MSPLALTAMLGVHRIPDNMKMKSDLLLQNANTYKSSQLSEDIRHRGPSLSRREQVT